MSTWASRSPERANRKAPTATRPHGMSGSGSVGRLAEGLTPKIAGRCWCGMVMEIVSAIPDEHLECLGLKWCGCGEMLPLDGSCNPRECRNRKSAGYRNRLRAYKRERRAA